VSRRRAQRNFCLSLGTYREENDTPRNQRPPQGAAAMTDRTHEVSDNDLRNLVRIVSICTLGLWAFAAGLLIGVFLLS
jgi:hypothetical protein